MSDCKLCSARGKTWQGDNPTCAFRDDGEDPAFSPANWNCATMNALRDAVAERVVWSEDQNAALLPMDGSFLVLSWYKSRGRTEGAWILSSDEMRPLTLQQAETLVAQLEPGRSTPDDAGRLTPRAPSPRRTR